MLNEIQNSEFDNLGMIAAKKSSVRGKDTLAQKFNYEIKSKLRTKVYLADI
jgi:hypothetical protein